MRYGDKILMAKSDEKDLYLLPKMANRHGLIAGATGTGKTITLKVMAESFSDLGVPVFLADVKGDLTGFCTAGADTEDMQKRIAQFALEDFELKSYPVRYWDLYGEAGTPVRATVSDMGPTFFSRLLNLTAVQSGVMNIVFKAADDAGLLLYDLKDLRAMLNYVGENRAEYTLSYGNISTASIGAVQRALLAFEEEGGETFMGTPGLEIRDLIRTDYDGRGYINVLSAGKIVGSPLTYSTFLLWMLGELYEKLPEVGDPEKPRLVFFFDEAHLLFNNCTKELISKITQTVKLIRSKGVGIYFITQSPGDVPGEVLAQLSNRVQHALHAYTPAEQKAIRAAAQGFRSNPAFKTEEILTELGVGEALVSFLDEKGVPCMVERAKILPPQSLMGPAETSVVNQILNVDELDIKYRDAEDPESAYEILMAAREQLQQQKAQEAAALEAEKKAQKDAVAAEKQAQKEAAAAEKEKQKKQAERTKTAERAVTAAATTMTRGITTNAVNSLTGGKITDTKTLSKRAATNALNSVVRTGTTKIIRGLFGNKK